MGLFDFLEMNKELTEEQKRWNKIWDMWAEGQADSPYAELMTYHGEINNGGHGQYFTNVENTGDLKMEMKTLETVLPSKLAYNLKEAYEAYLILEDRDDEQAAKTIEKCDNMFYANEAEINHILEEYAANIQL